MPILQSLRRHLTQAGARAGLDVDIAKPPVAARHDPPDLLPATRGLIDRLRRARDLETFLPGFSHPAVASYVLHLEPGCRAAPTVAFRTADGGAARLPGTVGVATEAIWSDDLAFAVREECAAVGQATVAGAQASLHLDHLVLPMFQAGRIVGARGWVVGSEGIGAALHRLCAQGAAPRVRALRRPREVAVPRRLLRIDQRSAAFHDMLAALNADWRGARPLHGQRMREPLA